MAFRINARTLLQLGAELISSDAVAFYELIKNSFDAGSQRVDINIVIRISHDDVSHIIDIIENMIVDEIDDDNNENIVKIKNVILSSIDTTAPHSRDLRDKVSRAKSLESLLQVVSNANYMRIEDSGEGMSLGDLNDVYLTIGTRSRQKVRITNQAASSSKSRPILGEKGVGRLAVMRLGKRLVVKTTKVGEKNWNLLKIDWNQFSHDSDKLLDEIDVAPELGPEKDDYEYSGTIIKINGLVSKWSESKLAKIASEEFSKLTDPFVPESRYPISVRYNGKALLIPPINKILFEQAHAFVEARFSIENNNIALSGKVNYRRYHREKTFTFDTVNLLSITDLNSIKYLRSLGPFGVKFYWYNRAILKAIDGIGTIKHVRDLLANWAGGLMVFRDGFRVNPYGSPDDDWLDLDRKALASSGYKVNRRQIMGKVDISSYKNRALVDQTNREGLRECEEKRVLVSLLQEIFFHVFKPFLDAVDKELKSKIPTTIDDVEAKVKGHEAQINSWINLIIENYPEVSKKTNIISEIKQLIIGMDDVIDEVKEISESFNQGRSQMVHLAGIGLMVESIAHELNRATSSVMSTISNIPDKSLPLAVISQLNILDAQLKTLHKRLRVLDPVAISGRQIKESFDLIEWINECITSHKEQFNRLNITYSIDIIPNTNKTFKIKAVKGMFVQILENLISNSVYWIKQQRKLEEDFAAEITIQINTLTKTICFTDNGPGIDPLMNDAIFDPFITTKPPGEGKGLGLFISREIAQYHNAELYLSDKMIVREDKLNTFILALEAKN